VSILGVVVCGAPLAARANDLVKYAQLAGWDVSLVPTDAASGWLESGAVEAGSAFQSPGTPKRRRPDALLVCPLTFNSCSKWALGIADNRPLSLMCEALGAGIPTVAVPMVNESLWRHPAWLGHLEVLTEQGVVLVDPVTGEPTPAPVRSGTGEQVAEEFEPQKVLELLAELRRGAAS
jgi:hypothetical protein